RQRLVGRVHAGEERVAAPAGDGKGKELGRLERLLVVGAVRVASLRAATVDGPVALAVRAKFVDAEHGYLGMLGVARGLRRMRNDEAEAAAVAQEVLDLELLLRHHHHVVGEPGAIDRVEPRGAETLASAPAA